MRFPTRAESHVAETASFKVTPPRTTCGPTGGGSGTRAGGGPPHAEDSLVARRVLDESSLDERRGPYGAGRAGLLGAVRCGVRRSGGNRPAAAVFLAPAGRSRF